MKCGRLDDLEFDHIIPVSWAISYNSFLNLQILCGDCNVRKSNKVSFDFRPMNRPILEKECLAEINILELLGGD